MSKECNSLTGRAKEENYSLMDCSLMGGLLAACLLLGTPQAAEAQLAGVNNEDFQRIEQTLGLKVAVSAAGAGLIGFELWWFLFSKGQKSKQLATNVAAAQPNISAAPLEPVLIETSLEEKPSVEPTDVVTPLLPSHNPMLQGSYKRLVDLSITYGGMQMSQCLLMVQDQMRPKFSMSL